MKYTSSEGNLFFKMMHDYLLIYLPKQKCSSPYTVMSCRTAINQMLDFFQAKLAVPLKAISFESLTRDEIMSFLDHLSEAKNVSASTRNQRLACIRGFVKYAASRNPELISIMLDLSSIPMQKTETNLAIDYLSLDAMKIIMEQPDTAKAKGIRDQFFMILMYDTAARIQEMIDLRICDIHVGKTPTVTVTGKGSKVRTIPLMAETVKHFENYMKIFHPDEEKTSTELLFYVNRKGNHQPISADAVRLFLNKYAAVAHASSSDVPNHIHPHLFRHSRAMHLYQNGMDLEMISQWLGHSSLHATLIYAHADTEQKRKAIEKANGDFLISRIDAPDSTMSDDLMIRKMCGLL